MVRYFKRRTTGTRIHSTCNRGRQTIWCGRRTCLPTKTSRLYYEFGWKWSLLRWCCFTEPILAWLRAKGFYLLPGVPNTTHITHVTNQNYGYFKTHYQENITKLTVYCQGFIPAKSLGMLDLPLLIFDGLVDGQDIGLVHSLALAFSFSKNKECWNKIGINPFNHNCLLSNMVKLRSGYVSWW